MERDVSEHGAPVVGGEISIHTLRMERDLVTTVEDGSITISIHTLRMERDATKAAENYCAYLFQSTRSAWSVTLGSWQGYPPFNISIHTLRMERDFMGAFDLKIPSAFQSTRSAWSVTRHHQV